MKKTFITFLCSTTLLIIGCFVARAIYGIINNQQYTDFIHEVMICLLVFITIAAIFKLQKLVICPAIGYNIGYALGFIFNAEHYDEGEGLNNTWWHWFVITIFISIIVGIIWEIITRLPRKKDLR